MKGCLRHHISNIANLAKYAYRLIMPLEQHYKIGGKKEQSKHWVGGKYQRLTSLQI
jgi:hypothetical protein